MEDALQGFQQMGCRVGMSQLILCIADAQIASDNLSKARQRLQEASEAITARGEKYFEPELLRLQGMLAIGENDAAGAEEFLGAAVALAREVGSIGLAQRALTSLIGLHTENGRPEMAQALLAEAEGKISVVTR